MPSKIMRNATSNGEYPGSGKTCADPQTTLHGNRRFARQQESP
ncbi:hypothetical protein [uncultured Methanomethylovorans sp.]|nr:hypothetical protein [uncultured Methanomethylovorans sp.]